MKIIDESELIAYHLRELSPLRMRAVKSALERDAALAAESEEIAETLRAFSGEAPPVVDAAMLERTWQTVRPSLAVLTPVERKRNWWPVALGAGLAAAMVAVLMVSFVHRIGKPVVVATMNRPTAPVETAQPAEVAVIHELQGAQTSPRRYNNHPGPLTTAPVGGDPLLAAHLDSAERLLTQVSHADGPLPAETRSEVHHLLLENAVYQQSAQAHGDLTTASVMDDLGRVLISLDAAPPQTAQGVDDFRLRMNVGGVLFDLRILHDNKRSGVE
jgi:hypothetical protein